MNISPMWRVAGFLGLQVAVVASVALAASRSAKQFEASRELPTPRETPLRVRPLYDYPWVVSDEQLHAVLGKLRPKFRGPNPKINHVDHALRMWGVEATFDDKDSLSGVELRDLLVNHKSFATAWGKQTLPLVYASGSGLKVRLQEGNATASHVDHTLAGLAEVGTPLSFPIRTARGTGTVRQLLEQSLREFSLNQTEYEWSVLAFALYLPEEHSWLSSEGQEITFDRLARRIMRQELSQGVCMGNHRLYTLTMLLRIDEETPILSTAGREEILAHLRGATEQLVSTQHAYGFWDGSWAGVAKKEAGESEATEEKSLANQILATGHALEWWAMAPVELHPPRETLVRAGQWLCRTIGELDEGKIASNYTFLSHAGRALSLWRGSFPAEAWSMFDGAQERTNDSESK